MLTSRVASVLAPAGGVVISVRDGRPDHRTRSSPLGVVLLFAGASLRELLGPDRLLGNHIVLDLGDGAYAVLAHLRRGSVRVTEGQRVRGGELVAECGNSGSSAEPHLHFQLVDSPRVLFAAGLPVEFERYDVEGRILRGVPRGGETFVAPMPA